MNKNRIIFALVLMLTAGAYCLVAFTLPFQHDEKFWIAYVATVFAFLLNFVLGLISFGKKKKTNKFLGISTLYIGYIYLMIQILLGFTFMLVPVWTWFCIAVSTLLTVLAIICMLSAKIGNEYIRATENRISEKKFYIASLQAELEIFLTKTEDASVSKMLTKLIDDVKYSDPVSHENLSSIEGNIETLTIELGAAIDSQDDDLSVSLISDLMQMVKERNIKCKSLKNIEK